MCISFVSIFITRAKVQIKNSLTKYPAYEFVITSPRKCFSIAMNFMFPAQKHMYPTQKHLYPTWEHMYPTWEHNFPNHQISFSQRPRKNFYYAFSNFASHSYYHQFLKLFLHFMPQLEKNAYLYTSILQRVQRHCWLRFSVQLSILWRECRKFKYHIV